MHSLLTMSMFVVLMLFTIGHIQIIIAQGCGSNEVESACAPSQSCQPSCDEPNGTTCPRLCDMNSCVCMEGYVRDNYNNLECIERTQCSNYATTTPSRCRSNEVETSCALLQSCQPSCDNPNGTACPPVCSENPCECQEGFVRHSKDDLTCIDQSQCEDNSDPPTCGENEEYSSCVSPCQPSCDNPGRRYCQPKRCLKGCMCSPGYLRTTNDTTSPCILCG